MNTTQASNAIGDVADQLTSQASDSADAALRSTQRFVKDAENLARRGMSAVADRSSQLRDQALRAQDTTLGYIKDEPMKSVLMAAAVGAVVIGLLALFTRSSRR